MGCGGAWCRSSSATGWRRGWCMKAAGSREPRSSSSASPSAPVGACSIRRRRCRTTSTATCGTAAVQTPESILVHPADSVAFGVRACAVGLPARRQGLRRQLRGEAVFYGEAVFQWTRRGRIGFNGIEAFAGPGIGQQHRGCFVLRVGGSDGVDAGRVRRSRRHGPGTVGLPPGRAGRGRPTRDRAAGYQSQQSTGPECEECADRGCHSDGNRVWGGVAKV